MGLFEAFRRIDATSHTPIYMFTFKIESGQTEVPPPMTCAYVLAYAAGDSPTRAAEIAWNELRAMGYVVTGMNPTGGQMALDDWDLHISERWPEFVDHFPKQKDVLEVLAKDNAIFGPFAGFEESH